MRSRAEYARARSLSKCVLCGQTALTDKTRCDDCTIRSRLRAVKKTGTVTVSTDEFIVWFKNKRAACAGQCEWCDESFDKFGEFASQDPKTGDLRFLICATCNSIKNYGIERLRKIIKAIDHQPVTTLNNIESNFGRWADYLNSALYNKDQKLEQIIKEMKMYCVSDEEINHYYNQFRYFVERQKVN